MISGLIIASRSWRCVGPFRCLAAALVLLGADLAVGVAIASLLGMRVGKSQ